MLKRKLVISSLLALSLSGTTAAATMAATVRGGGGFGGAAPEMLAPASTSVYIGLNRGGEQGLSLNALVNTYRAHPGTGAALAQIRAAIGMQGLQQLNTLFTAAGSRVGLAVWAPPLASLAAPGAGAGAAPLVQTHVAIIAQLKPASLNAAAHGANPLQGLVTFSAPMPYHGATVYRVAFNGGGSGYGAVISGDGVIGSDLTAVERVVDAATFRVPSLANDPDFLATTAQLPAPRALTVYVSRAYLRQSAQALNGVAGATQGMNTYSPMANPLFQHPYALAVVAHPRGIGIVSSNLAAANSSQLALTPNQAAGAVGANAIFYASVDNLAGMIRASGLLTPATLAQVQAQTGISLARDVYPLFGGETAIDVNDETSPLLQLILQSSANGAAVPTVPGSIEIVTQVPSQAVATAAIQRLVAVVARAAQQGQSGSGGALAVTPTTLPDGSTGYTFAGLPGLGYTFRSTPTGGTLLVLSTSLNADVIAARTPLSADPSYQAGLARVAGPGSLVSIEYISVSRLLNLINRIVTATQQGQSGAGTTMSLQQVEPLVAPFANITFVARQVGPAAEQLRGFIAVQ